MRFQGESLDVRVFVSDVLDGRRGFEGEGVFACADGKRFAITLKDVGAKRFLSGFRQVLRCKSRTASDC